MAGIPSPQEPIADANGKVTTRWRAWLQSLTGSVGSFLSSTVLTARGDLLTRDATEPVPLAIGSANTVLKSDGTDPSWSTVSALLDTLFGSTEGGILVRGASAWGFLAKGASGRLLTAGASTISWEPAPSAGQPIPTGSAGFGVGSTAFLEYTSTSALADGATTTSVEHLVFGSASHSTSPLAIIPGAGAAPGGTWRNDTGATLDANGASTGSFGVFTRTA